MCFFINRGRKHNGIQERRKYPEDLNLIGKILTSKTDSLFWSSLEIGLIETFGNIAYTVGLNATSATNATILQESVLIFVQIMTSFTGS